MVAIVLTGEIGAGKSTVRSWFASQGDFVLDADAIVSQLWQRPDVLAQAAKRWGSEIVSDGQLNRQLLARRVFSSATSQKELCELLHPLVRVEMERQLPAQGVTLAEIPLVFESGPPWWTEGILFLRAPLEVRSRRNQSRGLDEAELLRRERFFLDSKNRAERSDWVIDNGGSLEELYQSLYDLRRELLCLDGLIELRWCCSLQEQSTLNSLVEKHLLANLSTVKDQYNTDRMLCQGWSLSKHLAKLPQFSNRVLSKSFTMKVPQRRALLSVLQGC